MNILSIYLSCNMKSLEDPLTSPFVIFCQPDAIDCCCHQKKVTWKPHLHIKRREKNLVQSCKFSANLVQFSTSVKSFE